MPTIFPVFKYYENSEPDNPVKTLEGIFESLEKAQEYVLKDYDKHILEEYSLPDKWIIEEVTLNSIIRKEVASLDTREKRKKKYFAR